MLILPFFTYLNNRTFVKFYKGIYPEREEIFSLEEEA